MVAQEIGGYKVIKALGAGGMASVYQAEAPDGRQVALKFLHPQIASDPNARKRLQREADAINRVSSSGVAKVFEVNTQGETPYVAMELIKGVTIDQDVSEFGTWDLPDLIDLAQWLARILRELHSAGVVHRDVKPANIMISKQGPVLIDFGISQTPGAERLTATGLVTGTPGYISPQLIQGEDARPRDDWWAWLCVLLYCISGRPPFGSGPIEVVLGRINTGQADLSELPQSLQRVFEAGFQVDPERRATPDQLIAAFRAVNEGKDPADYLPEDSYLTDDSGFARAGTAALDTANVGAADPGPPPPSFPPASQHRGESEPSSAPSASGQATRLYPPAPPESGSPAGYQVASAGNYASNYPGGGVDPGVQPSAPGYGAVAGGVGGVPAQWEPRYIPNKLPNAWLSCLVLMLSLSLATEVFALKNNLHAPLTVSLGTVVLTALVAFCGLFGAFRARMRDAQLASGMVTPPSAALKAQPLWAPLHGVIVVTILVGVGVTLIGEYGDVLLLEPAQRILPEGWREQQAVYRVLLYLAYSLFGTIVAFFSRSFRVGFGSMVRLIGGAGARLFWGVVALAVSIGAEYMVVNFLW
ncbi:serine/threonine-protein kinase [Varibaculum prostatecancerukia]|uniref:serine/threonine-protein kinase n=1 Tax=Varibaculum prostatecancerukia TaxID=2811781 RepID=UPI001C00155F|nr:serine/threonine-protein kinase [Varibaculum prostatecancerukia]